ncbi:acetyltransferase [Mesobacillus selenatarsenatis]|uniref:Acetyltransferase n=1 Tax=Mesobacillus selenatarsenatis TaxID=388741 RepID=A0A846TKY4_9BACI|nr:acetyltransferase [Mesobacillus selenatarsenatis]NKE04715.1 acetyltransferase [Mesobacillus selenatarsenatis]
MKNIVIFGSGGHSKVIIDIVEKMGVYKIVGLIDGSKEAGAEVLGYKVLGGLNVLKAIDEDIYGGVVAVGDNWRRFQAVLGIKSIRETFNFITAIHPSAVIGKNATIGDGTVVMANAVINPDTTVGSHCIINTKSSVDHDCRIGDFVTVAPGAILAGTVKIGDHSVISLGANVIHNLSIGEHSVVGAGSTVLENIDAYTVAYGSPAKEIRKRVPGDKYL